eukprot:scaffold1161_cov70-Cylindrotheca_fusiformis.AAC.4
MMLNAWLMLLLFIFCSCVSDVSLAQFESDEWLSFRKPDNKDTNLSCNNSTIVPSIIEAVSKGHLSRAREIGRSAILPCQRIVAKTYSELADQLLLADDDDVGYYLELVEASLQLQPEASRPLPKIDDKESCWISMDPLFMAENWDRCCSTLEEFSMFAMQQQQQSSNQGPCFNLDGTALCCEFFEGSTSHIRLPALREMAIGLRLTLDNGTTKLLSLEQDGYLRQFDVASVLWPAGYLLSLCVAAPVKCGIPELSQLFHNNNTTVGNGSFSAIELGSGVGATSISLAIAMLESERTLSDEFPRIVATDQMPQSLALILANSYFNNVNGSVTTQQLDHFDLLQVEELTKSFFFDKNSSDGFSLVLGSSLLNFFDGTADENAPLWKALDILLTNSSNRHDPEGAAAAAGMALFSHTIEEPIQPPKDGRYTLVRRISGDVFQMHTRSLNTSDFEISMFQRNAKAQRKKDSSRDASESTEL